MEKGIEKLKNDVLALLCAATDLDTAINKVLEMIGSYFRVDRAYIFENTEDDKGCVNTFEWCNTGITPEIQNLQYLDYDRDLGFDWMDNYNEEGLFFCPQIKALPEKQRNVLEPQGIYSMLHCAILERGQFKGYIGFDNCDDHLIGWESDRDAVETLIYASRLLSIYLLEYRNKSRLMEMVKAEESKQQALQKALGDAERANLAKTDFLARMSHDIRTPLNAIIGLTALTLDEPDLTPTVKENLSNIRGSGDFLLGLVNDVLDMSKIEAGALKLTLRPYPYTEFLGKLRAMFAPQCTAKSIEFHFEEIKVNTTVLADKLRMDQIFFNLLSNAVKFTPEGGKITYRTANLQTDGKHIEADYIIEDTGIGMSPAFLAHVFDPFEQEDTGYSANLKGTGLGLSIAKSLTELMGGHIAIESELGRGTKVTVHLGFTLCEGGAVAETAAAPQSTDAALRGAHVLLVEDHPLNAQIARRLLEKKGVVVLHAANGAKAVDLFSAAKPGAFDAVLMDIRMPVMDGLAATRAIRALPRADAQTVPIIAMSANAYEEDVEKSLAAGMNAHLAKPVEPQALYNMLAKYLQKAPSDEGAVTAKP